MNKVNERGGMMQTIMIRYEAFALAGVVSISSQILPLKSSLHCIA